MKIKKLSNYEKLLIIKLIIEDWHPVHINKNGRSERWLDRCAAEIYKHVKTIK
jgi:hypothetical protein